jgi:hypothetical protein
MYDGQGEKIDGGILEAILSYSKNLENTLNLFGGKENISKTTSSVLRFCSTGFSYFFRILNSLFRKD